MFPVTVCPAWGKLVHARILQEIELWNFAKLLSTPDVAHLLSLPGTGLPGGHRMGYKTWFLDLIGNGCWLWRPRLLGFGQWCWWSVIAVYSTAVSNTIQSRSAMTISTGRGYFISFLTIFFHLVRWLWPQLCLENIGKQNYVVNLD